MDNPSFINFLLWLVLSAENQKIWAECSLWPLSKPRCLKYT